MTSTEAVKLFICMTNQQFFHIEWMSMHKYVQTIIPFCFAKTNFLYPSHFAWLLYFSFSERLSSLHACNFQGEKYKDQEQVHRICLSASTGKREMMHVMYILPLHISFQIQLIAILDEIFLCDLMLYVIKCSIKIYLCDEMLISCWYILGWAEMIMLFIWAV